MLASIIYNYGKFCDNFKSTLKLGAYFVSSYACSLETAAYDFKYTLDHCRENSPNKAYHLIQAFAPGEVGFEEAHRIGKELADKLLEGKYSYVVTTHIDKGHVLHMAHPNGRVCGAKRPKCEAERSHHL